MLPPPPPELEEIDAEFAAEEPKPRLSVEVVRAETTLIPRQFRLIRGRPRDGSAAVVMSFKNQLAKPGKQNETFRRVTANLTFVGSDRTEHIDYGNWLNEYARYVDFRPGETHTLVIAMVTIKIQGKLSASSIKKRLIREKDDLDLDTPFLGLNTAAFHSRLVK